MIGHKKYVDQACKLYENPENPHWDDRGGELCDIIEDLQSYNDFTRKGFNFESYLNSNIDY